MELQKVYCVTEGNLAMVTGQPDRVTAYLDRALGDDSPGRFWYTHVVGVCHATFKGGADNRTVEVYETLLNL